jgi:peptidoglycan hydrolase-like protein with peptidoglycan-binding domain
MTRNAVRAEQEAMGVPTDGRVGRKILDAVRQRVANPAT